MKVLFDHPLPFWLAHGGMQIQIEQTRAALESIGVEVEPVHWWDIAQRGDLIHFFERPSPHYVHLAKTKGIKIVFSCLHSSMGSRSRFKLWVQKALTRLTKRAMPTMILRIGWESYRNADACIVLTPWEAHLVKFIFDAPPEKVHIIPNGIEDVFFAAPGKPRGQWLITTATILPVKRIVETAEAAVRAKTPYWVIGKPFTEDSPYYQTFLNLVRAHPGLLRYDGPVTDRAQLAGIYREARGFVMLSKWESLSLSALEAAAAGCPLLLSDLPWAHSVFGDHVSYCPTRRFMSDAPPALRQFYDEAPQLPPPPKPQNWRDVAQQLKALYESLLNTSR